MTLFNTINNFKSAYWIIERCSLYVSRSLFILLTTWGIKNILHNNVFLFTKKNFIKWFLMNMGFLSWDITKVIKYLLLPRPPARVYRLVLYRILLIPVCEHCAWVQRHFWYVHLRFAWRSSHLKWRPSLSKYLVHYSVTTNFSCFTFKIDSHSHVVPFSSSSCCATYSSYQAII